MSDLRNRLLGALFKQGSASSDFDLNNDVVVPQVKQTPAAVLVAIHPVLETVIFTKRATRLKHHPGQIAFPGGKQDATDATITATALREAQEEIGLPPGVVDILGPLPTHQTVTGYNVTPIVGLLTAAYDPIPEAAEVSEIFEVPLSHIIDPNMFRIENRLWQGKPRYFYTIPFGPYYIWGATACILRGLADRMV